MVAKDESNKWKDDAKLISLITAGIIGASA